MSNISRTEIVLASGRTFSVLLAEGGFYLETSARHEPPRMVSFMTPDEGRVVAALLIAASDVGEDGPQCPTV